MTALPFPVAAKSEEGQPPLLARARRSWVYAYLAAAAARELAIREKRYPEKIAAGEIAKDDAEGDLEAWRTILALFTDGSAETFLTWAVLELATSRAVRSREEALARAPDDEDLIARRSAVWAIHERITWNRSFWSLDRADRGLAPAHGLREAEAA